MNQTVEDNIKVISNLISACENTIADTKQEEKDTKNAIKVLTKTQEQFESNPVLQAENELFNILNAVLASLTTGLDTFNDIISAEKEKMKKYNKALLALQEINN